MFSRFQQPATTLARGLATSSPNNVAVAVMGASGGKIENMVKKMNTSNHFAT